MWLQIQISTLIKGEERTWKKKEYSASQIVFDRLLPRKNQETAILYDSTKKMILILICNIKDKSRTLTIDDISIEALSQQFEKYVDNARSYLGFSLSSYWIRIQINNESTLRTKIL